MLAARLEHRRRPDGWWVEATLVAKPPALLWLFSKLRGLRHN
jgi:hypothetical protein